MKYPRPKQRKGLPWLTDIQIETVKSYLNKQHRFLEFGCGHSTNFYADLTKMVYSLEPKLSWYQKIKENIKDNVMLIHTGFNYKGPEPGVQGSDISQEDYDRIKKDFPYANDHAIKRYWQHRDFVNSVSKFNVDIFDRVMIDGRARSFCAFNAHNFIDKESIVFVDNYFGRPGYYDIMESGLYKQIDQSETLIILRKA